jgi:hypothetical protein
MLSSSLRVRRFGRIYHRYLTETCVNHFIAVFVMFAAGDTDITAPGDDWRRGGQVTTLPGRGHGPELCDRTDYRAVGTRRRESCGVPAGAAEGGPHVAHQAR